jgi:hypothetical protein
VSFVVPRETPAVFELASFVIDACESTRATIGARIVALFGETFTMPAVRDSTEGFMFVKLAGKRGCVLFVFDAPPTWLDRVNTFGDYPPMSLSPREAHETFMRWRPELDPAATVASLVLYLETLLEAFVSHHPADAELFPELDDAAVARIFQ